MSQIDFTDHGFNAICALLVGSRSLAKACAPSLSPYESFGCLSILDRWIQCYRRLGGIEWVIVLHNMMAESREIGAYYRFESHKWCPYQMQMNIPCLFYDTGRRAAKQGQPYRLFNKGLATAS